MDRITENSPVSEKGIQWFVVALVILLIAGVMIFKAADQGWLIHREPLDLSNGPVLLFFNRHKGCECEMVVYTAAENQIAEWTESGRLGISVIQIDLDRRPDLRKQFDIVRVPALLLVDPEGNVLFGQRESISDTAPLDLHSFRDAIDEFKNGK